jgi:hypothetical protein
VTLLVHALDSATSGLLLAATPNRASQMGKRFPPTESSFDVEQMITVASVTTVALGILVLVWLISARYRTYRQQEYHSPRRLFRELARVHQLTAADCQLLREIATWHQMPTATLLFVEPTRFYAPQMIETLGKQEQISKLAEKLFAASSGDP